MPSPYEQMDPRYTCCVGPLRTNVEKCAFVIAFLGCAINVIYAIVAFLPNSGSHQQSIPAGVLYLVGAVMYLSIIAAQQKRIPAMYLPYLIFMAISLICGCFFFFFMVGLAIAAPQSFIDAINKEYPELHITVVEFRMIMSLSALTCFLSVCLNGWFYSVVFRAYKYMKEVTGNGEGVLPV